MGDEGHKQEYISVGELSVGFSENILPATDALAGRKVELHYESGKKAIITFIDGETLKWETEEQGCKKRSTCSYRAIVPRSDIYFVDFIVSIGGTKSVSIILDLQWKCATIVTGLLPTTEEVMNPLIIRAEKGLPLTSVRALFDHAAIGGPFTSQTYRHERTTDLVGKRIQWVYSSKDAYEHIYLNENTYTWHCISGNEKGLADTDRCFYYKVSDKFYLFTWIEKTIPTVGVVLEDLNLMRSYGKIFGYEGYTIGGRISNFPVGSYGTLLNKTEYNLYRIEKQTDHK